MSEQRSERIGGNASGTLTAPGDGTLLCELHSHEHRVDRGVIELLVEATGTVSRPSAQHSLTPSSRGGFEALVIGSRGEHFGIGADLVEIHQLARDGRVGEIDTRVREFQNALIGLRDAPVPVVAAPFLYALGGSTEIALAADACQSLSEVYMGLVEVGVGLVPAGGGCLAMVERWTQALDGLPEDTDPLPFLQQALENLALSRVTSGPEEARRCRYLRANDGVSATRDELLPHARHRALGLARSGYRTPPHRRLRAPDSRIREALEHHLDALRERDTLDEHDRLIAGKIASILTGGDAPAGTVLGRQDLLDLERQAFVALCSDERSLARMGEVVLGSPPS